MAPATSWGVARRSIIGKRSIVLDGRSFDAGLADCVTTARSHRAALARRHRGRHRHAVQSARPVRPPRRLLSAGATPPTSRPVPYSDFAMPLVTPLPADHSPEVARVAQFFNET